MDDGTHGRIRVLQRPEGDGLGVTLWGTEYVQSPDVWRELAVRILAACPAPSAKQKIAHQDLRVGMVFRMTKGGVRRIEAIEPNSHGLDQRWSTVRWARVDGGRCGSGNQTAYYFAKDAAELLSHG